MASFNTQRDITIITLKTSHNIAATLITSLLFTNVFFLVFLSFFSVGIFTNPVFSLYGAAIFVLSMINGLLIKAEYIIAEKSQFEVKPPLQVLTLLLSTFVMLYFLFPDKYVVDKIYLIAFIFLMAIAVTPIYYKLYDLTFFLIVKIISKFFSHPIYIKDELYQKIETKFQETKRYGGKFSVLMLSLSMDRTYALKFKQNMIYSLFVEILKSIIRTTDTLGIFNDGTTAGIFSSNNNMQEAEVHAKRLIETLENTSILRDKIKVYQSKVKCGIAEYNENIKDSKEIISNALNALNIALNSEEKQIITYS
ncbi:MAG: hypothetical protein JW969_20280 [Spirochaetales bacterium]|nr:hypothetical protein [Spirochaetales bacterium]